MIPKEAARHQRFAARRSAVLLAQGGVCAICGTDDPGSYHGWCLDHDHACCPQRANRSCGKCDRGVLCVGCNNKMAARDDLAFMHSSDEYLTAYKQRLTKQLCAWLGFQGPLIIPTIIMRGAANGNR